MDKDIVSIWVSYTEQANELTNKRLTMSSFFFAISAALLGISIPYLGISSLIASIVGILLCAAWCVMIRSFKILNESKFEVIAELEKEMIIKPYDKEWAFAKRKKYPKITIVEMIISLIFMFGFISLVILSILKMIGKI